MAGDLWLVLSEYILHIITYLIFISIYGYYLKVVIAFQVFVKTFHVQKKDVFIFHKQGTCHRET